jgi:hypothetical protein
MIRSLNVTFPSTVTLAMLGKLLHIIIFTFLLRLWRSTIPDLSVVRHVHNLLDRHLTRCLLHMSFTHLRVPQHVLR